MIDQKAIAQLPLGASTPLNQVPLQAPGVVQGNAGNIYVRGDHANLQYRINGVIIPESISGFGQTLDVRTIKSVKLLDGALPAQYGLRTAAGIDINTKSGAELGNGGAYVFPADANANHSGHEMKPDRQHHRGKKTRHYVIDHHPDATLDPAIKPANGPRLPHVEQAEQHEAGHQHPPAKIVGRQQ